MSETHTSTDNFNWTVKHNQVLDAVMYTSTCESDDPDSDYHHTVSIALRYADDRADVSIDICSNKVSVVASIAKHDDTTWTQLFKRAEAAAISMLKV